jgi:8-oxo-dGTP pyrophosphatase MutT (NUDIX family)
MPYAPRILLYRFLYQLARLYWKIFSPGNKSAVCLIEFEGKILLARNTYGDKKWVFPGGGCKKSETPAESARREAAEEVGINLELLCDIGIYTNSVVNKNAIVYCFYSETNNSKILIDENEIGEAGWFEWSDLPQPLSLDTVGIIELYKSYKAHSSTTN